MPNGGPDTKIAAYVARLDVLTMVHRAAMTIVNCQIQGRRTRSGTRHPGLMAGLEDGDPYRDL
jgi:hypothetical protein